MTVPEKAPRQRFRAAPAFFAAYVDRLRAAARERGYALAVHGSMATDLDVVAVPWVDDAAPPEDLAEALRAVVDGHILARICPSCLRAVTTCPHVDGNPTARPHGRLAWAIYLNRAGDGPYLDVSVMPRASGGTIRPVDQTVLHDEAAGVRGNCTEAVIATLLGVGIDEVPVLADVDDAGRSRTIAIDRWACDRFGLGYWYARWDGSWMPEVPHLLAGLGPRGTRHAVVGFGGEVLHDPHPSRAGLVERDAIGFFLPVMPWRVSLAGRAR